MTTVIDDDKNLFMFAHLRDQPFVIYRTNMADMNTFELLEELYWLRCQFAYVGEPAFKFRSFENRLRSGA